MLRVLRRVLPLMFAGVLSVSAQEAAPAAGEVNAGTEKTVAVNRELKTKVEAALAEQKDWMIFQKGKGVSRLKLFGQQNYYGPKENDIFKVAKVDGKYYAQVKSGTIFEEHWENKDKFQHNFVPYAKFIADFDKQIETQGQKIEKENKEYEQNQSEIDQLRKKARDINDDIASFRRQMQQKSNEKKNTDYEQRQINSLESLLKATNKKITNHEKDNKEIKRDLKKLEQDLDKLKDQRKKYPEVQ